MALVMVVPNVLVVGPSVSARDVREPLLARRLVHCHQVLVEETDEVHAEALARVLHEIDDVAWAVEADLAVVRKGDVVVALGVCLLLHVAGYAQVEAEAADQRAAVAGVDVEPSPRQHALLGEEGHAVLEIDLERKQLPRRIRQAIQVHEERLLWIQMRLARGVAPDEPGDVCPVAVARVHAAEDLRERGEGLPHGAHVHLGQEAHDLVRHAGEKTAARHDEGLGRQLLGHRHDVLDRTVGGGDTAYGDHVPAVRLEDLGDHRVRRAPRVVVVDLDLMALAHHDGREERHPVGHVARLILLAHHGIDEEQLSHRGGPSREAWQRSPGTCRTGPS